MPDELPDAAARSVPAGLAVCGGSSSATRMTARPAAWSGKSRPAARTRTSAARRAARRTATAIARPVCGDCASIQISAARSATSPRRRWTTPTAARRRARTPTPCTEDRLISAGTCAAGVCTCRSPRCVPATAAAHRPPAATSCSIADCAPVVRQRRRREPRPSAATAGSSGSCPGPGRLPDERVLHPLRPARAPPRPATRPASPCRSPGARRRRLLPARLLHRQRFATASRSAATASSRDGESCDRAITAGHPGACLRTCDDGNACTVDFASGSAEGCTRTCIHQPITGCIAGDGCCPPGCSGANDGDCDAALRRRAHRRGRDLRSPQHLPHLLPGRRRSVHGRAADRRRRRAATSPAATSRSRPARAPPATPAARPGVRRPTTGTADAGSGPFPEILRTARA